MGNLRIKAYLAAPRSLSQLLASFIGILRQGIHSVRLSNFLRLDRDSLQNPILQLTSYWCSPIAVCLQILLKKFVIALSICHEFLSC